MGTVEVMDILAPLIEERAGWITKPALKPVRRGLEWLLRYPESVHLAQRFTSYPSQDILSEMSSRIARNVQVEGLNNIPTNGAALVVANHPTGIADGLVMWHVLARLRRDAYFFANRDILRVLPQLSEHIVSVEWRVENRTHAQAKQTLQDTRRAVADGRLGVIFPSGRLAKRRGLTLHERPWMHSAAMIARKYQLPVIPIHLRARNSALFYAFDALHPTLRDITLFYETLNKDRQAFDVRIGTPIPAEDLPTDPASAIARLRADTLALDVAPRISNVPLGSGFAKYAS